jgi:tRNA A37 threonylcarbamoyladenosine dehydratase
LTLIDMDHVSESNVNRQIHALTPTFGMSKIEAMRQRVALIHPNCNVSLVEDFVSPENWPALLPTRVDAVIDACDQVRSKTAMSHWARETGATFITVGAAGGKRLAQRVEIADLSKVTHDPLLAQMRYRLRKFHGAPQSARAMGVACVFSAESVHTPAGATDASRDATLNCHGYGSIVTVTATFGLCAAGWVMDKLSKPAGL